MNNEFYDLCFAFVFQRTLVLRECLFQQRTKLLEGYIHNILPFRKASSKADDWLL